MKNFSHGYNVLKSHLLLLRQNASVGGKRVTRYCSQATGYLFHIDYLTQWLKTNNTRHNYLGQSLERTDGRDDVRAHDS